MSRRDPYAQRSTYWRKYLRKPRRGAIVVLAALLMAVLFGMVAFSVDVGNVCAAKARLQAASDAAAMAAASVMAQSSSNDQIINEAVKFANLNLPDSYGSAVTSSDVELGTWEPLTRTFVSNSLTPNAVRITAQRTASRGNPADFIFGRIFGRSSADIVVQSVAVGPAANPLAPSYTSVYVTSTKDLSNVVLEFEDGTHQKFEGLSGYTGTFQGTLLNVGKDIVKVWIKSGCNHSADGPGYGERLENPWSESTVHGAPASGCKPHVTATFNATGVTFDSTAAPSPVRLVY